MDDRDSEIQASLSIISEIPAIEPILDVICRNTGMGFAAVAIVTDHRWVAAAVKDQINFGLTPGGELKLESTICNEIRQHGQEVVIDHVAADENFCNHHTPLQYGFQSYISIPIFLKNGDFFGTLCAIDPSPASLNNPETINMFKLYADLISFYIQSARQVKETEAKLEEEHRNAEIRELFLAILSHDLRSPLTAAGNAGKVIQRLSTNKTITDMAKVVQHSSYRMKSLIDNVVEYSRNRVGPGWQADIKPQPDLQSRLEETVAELQTNWPNRAIQIDFNLKDCVNCDVDLVSQLLSNLVANALIHGDAEKEIKISLQSCEGQFCLKVLNHGEPISQDSLARIFKPFAQSGAQDARRKGLGLGLHIVSEIAQLHGGNVTVESDNDGTIFTFTMPSAALFQ